MNGVSSLVAEGAGKVDVAGEIHGLGVAGGGRSGAGCSGLSDPTWEHRNIPQASPPEVFCALHVNGEWAQQHPTASRSFFLFLIPNSSLSSGNRSLALPCLIAQLQGGVSAFIRGPGVFLTALMPRIPEN